MVSFTFQQMMASGPANYLTGISDLDIRLSGATPVLYAASGPSGGVTSYRLSGTVATRIDSDPFLPGQIQASPGQLQELTLNGQTMLVSLGHHVSAPQCFEIGVDGTLTSTGTLTAQGGFPAAIVSMESARIGGTDFVYVSHFGMEGISVYETNALGQLVGIGAVRSPVGAQAADLVSQTRVETGGQTYLMTLSAVDNVVTSYRLGSNGLPVQVDLMDAAAGLTISGATAMVPISVNDARFLVVAGGESSSLSVLAVAADGSLSPTDHIIDDLNTRFAGVAALEVAMIGGRPYLVAGGGDDGLSLFTLLPGGRLLHLAQIADSAQTGLSNVSALALHVDGGVLHVFASAQGAPGITHLTVDTGTVGQSLSLGSTGGALTGTPGGDVLSGGAGNDSLNGADGDDILIDGAGSDTLRGGAGADVFVFTADGVVDTVMDFELGRDRLDLSGFGRIYSLAQLTITGTSYGAVIHAGAEEVRLYSMTGVPLAPGSFRIGDLVDVNHFNLAPTAPRGDIIGDDGNNVLTGTDIGERFEGRGGNDRIEAAGGNDTALGGDGNDTLLGGTGNDTLDGGTGADQLFGETGDDEINGGAGADMMQGGDGDDALTGGAGNDTLMGQNGNDRLSGDAGDDILNGDHGNDTIYGGDGNDVLRGGAQEDAMSGGAGNDTIYGDAGFDRLLGGDGNDLLDGGAQADNLLGQGGDDRLFGGQGFDRLFGGTGQDVLYGGEGTDGLFGEQGHDTVYGQQDNDRIFGGTGNDLIDGGSEDDVLYGGAGFDTLIGGTGNDTLSGNFNADTFVFADFGGGFGHDTITDFDARNNFERIDLSRVFEISDLADLMANHIDQVGSHVRIYAGGGNTITLLNTNLADLDAFDFTF